MPITRNRLSIKKTLTLKNAPANWAALAVYSVVGFFLAPFVLHRLGEEQYGLYYLVFSFLGYYSVLDLGMESSTEKYVASYYATGDEEGLNCLIALVVVALVCVGAMYLGSIFRLSPAFLRAVRRRQGK